MKKSRYKEEQIIAVLKEVDAGGKVQDVVRKLGITEQTYYRWKAKYGGMEVSDAKKLRGLEDENRRLKHMVADQALDIQALKAVISKKW
jgi:putative transposase